MWRRFSYYRKLLLILSDYFVIKTNKFDNGWLHRPTIFSMICEELKHKKALSIVFVLSKIDRDSCFCIRFRKSLKMFVPTCVWWVRLNLSAHWKTHHQQNHHLRWLEKNVYKIMFWMMFILLVRGSWGRSFRIWPSKNTPCLPRVNSEVFLKYVP